MKEDFLHYIWKFKKFDFAKAETTNGESIVLVKTGLHNQDRSGPDFFNAKLEINGQLWAGNVEIHLKSSDWYAHHHETDPAYDNVILHVVWEHDVAIHRKDNSPIPTMVLKGITDKNAVKNYRELLGFKDQKWINCEADFSDFTDFDVKNWLELLYIERLQRKTTGIHKILSETTNDWEATLFRMLAKNFGLNVNGEAFLSLANATPYHIVRKIGRLPQMEALLFGQAGMLDNSSDEPYYLSLQDEYHYLRHKFGLSRKGVLPISYFRLRPQNFPTIRLSQLAVLLHTHKNLFEQLIENDNPKALRRIFSVRASDFWKTHYTFGKESPARPKKLTKNFVDLVLINTVVPLKFCYRNHKGAADPEALFALMRDLPTEKNSIIDGFNKLRPKTAENALDSQALIQLKKEYCDKNRCLHCKLGLKLLQKG